MEKISITRAESKKLQKKLNFRGFISRNTVINQDYRKKYNIPEYTELRKLAESDTITAIKVTTSSKNVTTDSYWFSKNEIESLWIGQIICTIPNITNNSTIRSSELKNSNNKEVRVSSTFKSEQLDKNTQELINKNIELSIAKLVAVGDDIVDQIENKAYELLGIIDNPPLKLPDINVFCPYTIKWAQNIFTEGVEAALKNRCKYTIEYAERKAKLDAGIPDNTPWLTGTSSDIEYSIMRNDGNKKGL